MNVLLLWLMVNGGFFSLRCRKIFSFIQKITPKGQMGCSSGKKIWQRRIQLWPKIRVLHILAFSLFLFKCYFYNHDNVNRCRTKHVAGKWYLCLYMSDGFMTLYKLGVGSGRVWHVSFIMPVSPQSTCHTGAPHSRTNISTFMAHPEQLPCSSTLS